MRVAEVGGPKRWLVGADKKLKWSTKICEVAAYHTPFLHDWALSALYSNVSIEANASL